MKIHTLISGMLKNNTYIIADEQTNEAAIIDPGWRNKKLPKFIDEHDYNYKYIFLTHGHFDHAVDTHIIHKRTGAKIVIHESEAPALYGDFLAGYSNSFEKCFPEREVKGGEVFSIGNEEIKVLHTPGHSPGSICLVCGNMIFSGDTLFEHNIGRTDFENGSYEDIVKSIKTLYSLDGNFDVYPGHMEKTTLAEERKNNPYVKA